MAKSSLSVRIDLPGGRIGPGKIALLKALQSHGSITAAAKALGMSYRRAWTLSEEINALGAVPLIAKGSGGASRGGAHLTEEGRQLLALCEKLVDSAQAAAAPDLKALGRLLGEG